MACVDVAIDAIVCGGDLAVGEPGPGLVGGATWEGLGLLSQSSRGLSVPVEPARVMGPEGLWVGEGVRVGCLLGHGWNWKNWDGLVRQKRDIIQKYEHFTRGKRQRQEEEL